MLRTARAFLIILGLVGLASCAPVILGRTPTPAAPGKTELSVSAGYPVGLSEVPALPENGGIRDRDPAYWPLPLPLSFRVAYGRNETLETNLELMVSPGITGSVASGAPFGGSNLNAGVRYGAQNLLQQESVELAFDFGASGYAPSITLGADAGILAAVPLEDAKLYGGLRGFVGSFPGIGALALTLGGEVPLENTQSVMLELTVLTNRYNGAEYFIPRPTPSNPNLPLPPPPHPIGFTLVPAVAFNF